MLSKAESINFEYIFGLSVEEIAELFAESEEPDTENPFDEPWVNPFEDPFEDPDPKGTIRTVRPHRRQRQAMDLAQYQAILNRNQQGVKNAV